MVVRDAFGVQAPARPVTSLCSVASLLSTAFAPIMFGLVLPDQVYVFSGPQPNVKRPQRLHFRCGNLLLTNPTVETVGRDIQDSRNFNRRIGLRHEYSGTHT